MLPLVQYSGLLMAHEGSGHYRVLNHQIPRTEEMLNAPHIAMLYEGAGYYRLPENEGAPSFLTNNNPKSNLAMYYERFHVAYINASTSVQIATEDALKLSELGLAFYSLAKREFPEFTSKTEAKTFKGKKCIEEFIKKHAPFLLEITNLLKNSLDEDEQQAALSFMELAFALDPTLKKDKSLSEKEEKCRLSSMQLYQTLSGEICLKFQSELERDQFLKSFGSLGSIEKQFRVGEQFKHNPEGKTPVCYTQFKNAVYFPSYRAKGGELAINFGSQEKKEKFLSILGLALPQWSAYTNLTREYKDSEGKVIFCTYGGTQSSTIYFGQEGSQTTPFDVDSYLRFERKEKEQEIVMIYSCSRQLMRLEDTLSFEKDLDLVKMKMIS